MTECYFSGAISLMQRNGFYWNRNEVRIHYVAWKEEFPPLFSAWFVYLFVFPRILALLFLLTAHPRGSLTLTPWLCSFPFLQWGKFQEKIQADREEGLVVTTVRKQNSYLKTNCNFTVTAFAFFFFFFSHKWKEMMKREKGITG